MLNGNCNKCNTYYKVSINGTQNYICTSCGQLMTRKVNEFLDGGENLKTSEDLSPIQIGTSGKLNGNKFEIIGRLRYQFETGYINEWSLLYYNGKQAFLGEGFGVYSYYEKKETLITSSFLNQLKLDTEVEFESKIFNVIGEYLVLNFTGEGELFKPVSNTNEVKRYELFSGENELTVVGVDQFGTGAIYCGAYKEFEDFEFYNIRKLNW